MSGTESPLTRSVGVRRLGSTTVAGLVGGLRPKRVLTATTAIFVGYVAAFLLGYLAFLLDGQPLRSVWQVYRFKPLHLSGLEGLLPQVVLCAGYCAIWTAACWGICAVMLQIAAVRTEQVLSIRDSLVQSAHRIGTLLIGWGILAIPVVLSLLLIAAALLATHLPLFGPLLGGTAGLLLGTLLGPVLLVMLTMLIASQVQFPLLISRSNRSGLDSFTLALETASLIVRKPLHWFLAFGTALVCARIGGLLVAASLILGSSAMFAIARMIGSSGFLNQFRQALGLLFFDNQTARSLLTVWPGGWELVSLFPATSSTEPSLTVISLAIILLFGLCTMTGAMFSVLAAVYAELIELLATDLKPNMPPSTLSEPEERSADA